MSKKLFCLVTVMMIITAILAGCSGNAATPTPAPANTPTPANTPALSGNISTNGSTSMEKVIASLIESFTAQNPGVTITYDATGSGSGITAAAEGTADIGLSSRNLKDSETDLTATVIALDGIAIIVNNANTVSDLTVEQIAGLFNGEISDWSAVGGTSNPITVIGREAGSGTRDGFESIIGITDNCIYDQELTSTGAVITAVASNQYAIGYASLSAINSEVKTVSVAGVRCTEETVLDGSYAVQRPFVMVTSDSRELSPAAQAFIEFALSADAGEIIATAGAVQPR